METEKDEKNVWGSNREEKQKKKTMSDRMKI